MLRDDLNEMLKTSMREKNTRAVSTVRLILTAIKDRDIAARGKGNAEGISDSDILQVLQTMVRQREESIVLYKQGGRQELADQEAEEIEIIGNFLPRQLDEAETESAVDEVVSEIGASSIKDMGRAMGVLRDRYAGQMNFGAASALLKAKLGAA